MNKARAVRSKENFLVFGKPAIEEAEIQEVVQSLRSGWIGTGPKVAEFERAFAAYKGVEFAAAVNSCTAALHLSLLASGVQPQDEVITTPLTFCATVNAIIHAGAVPVLADVDLHSMNLDPKQVSRKLSKKTKAILPVHFAGRPCDMAAMLQISTANHVKLIEDCAHAIEAECLGKKTGTFGDFSCFSFYVTKNITTCEGGMILARREADMQLVKILGLHGMSRDAWKRFSDEGYKHYQVVEAGFKFNMTDIQACIGLHQLARIDKSWLRRQQIWNLYNQGLSGLPITLPAAPEPGTRHSFHLYTVLLDEGAAGMSRDQFLAAIGAHNIGVGVHYLSIPEHPYYRTRYGWRAEEYPNAMEIGRRTVSLPLSANLTDKDVEDVITAVRLVLV